MTRSFTKDPLPKDLLDDLLALATRAPSAGNAQGRDFLVLEGKEQTSTFWELTTTSQWWERNPRRKPLRHAPVVVLPIANQQCYLSRYSEADKAGSGLSDPASWPVPFWQIDAGFATMLLLLAAQDAGLGAAFLGIFRGEDRLLATFGIPEGCRPIGAVLLGYPAQTDPPSPSTHRPRRAFEEVIHRGHW